MELQLILDGQAVNEYLAEHGLEHGNVPIDAVLLQAGGSAAGAPCVMLIVSIDGRKHVIKTTFRLFDMAHSVLLSAIQQPTTPASRSH